MDLKKNVDCFISPANMELNSHQTANHKSYPCEHEMQVEEKKVSTSDNIFHEEVDPRSYISKENNINDDVNNTLITGVCLDSSSNGFAAPSEIIINLKDKISSPHVEPGGIAIKDFDSVLIAEKTKPIEIYYEDENLNECVDSDAPLLSSSVESDIPLLSTSVKCHVPLLSSSVESDTPLLSSSVESDGSVDMEILNPLDISKRNESDTDVSLLSLSSDEVSNSEPEEYINYDLAYVTASDNYNTLPNVADSKSDKFVYPLNLSNQPTDTLHSYDNIITDSKEVFVPEAKQLTEIFMDQNPHSTVIIDSSISIHHSQTCLEESLISNASQMNGNEQQLYGEAIQGTLTLEKQDSCDSTLPLIETEVISVDPIYSSETNNFSKEKDVSLLHLFGSSNLLSTSHCSSQEHVNLSDACIHMLNNLNNSYSNISLMHISSLKNIEEAYKDNMSVISSEITKTTNHWKNLIAYSIGFMVMNMAFGSLRHLQSSINNSNGIGLITLSCLFAFFVIGSLFASYVVKQLEPRRATLVTVLFHIIYVISNCYPSIYILMPASALLGFWNAVSWGAQGVYIQRLSCDYAMKKGQKTEHICSKFHGVFYLILFFSEVFGNLISSLILSVSNTGSSLNEQNQTEFHYVSSTIETITNRSQQCGIRYSHINHEDEKTAPISQNTIFLLTAIFTGLDLLAFAIIFFFVDPLTSYYNNILPQTAGSCGKVWRDLKSVLIFMKDWRFLLLIPIYLFSAMHLAYISAEITKAFATCMLGVHMVGYLMICYGISDALSSYISGWLNQITGRILLITIGSLSFQLVILSLFLWQPVASSLIPYILIFGFWGLSDGFYASQLCSLTGMVFSETSEEAFSAFRMMQGVGLTLAYAYASSLTLDIKLYILSGVGIIAWIMYILMEYYLRKNDHAKSSTTKNNQVLNA